MAETSLLNEIERADVAAAAKAGEHRHDSVVRAAGAMAKGADQPPMFTLASAVLGAGLAIGSPRAAEAGGRMLVALAVATAVKAAVKASVVRTRPNVLWDQGRYETGLWGPNEAPWNSFPSGHTANAVAVARAVGRVVPEARPALWALAAVAGGVQVPRGAHHPLDVAAGHWWAGPRRRWRTGPGRWPRRCLARRWRRCMGRAMSGRGGRARRAGSRRRRCVAG
ncbi:putative integral membrane protein [Rubellimicrobium mesophilum DSM 19309]|uniref:Putative integral membrane protein n=1 Tax=Rubellimicrobium mesophilum DSM 19309 TaxID=442562 RepID=A0A017HRA3_9RHOB|nr:phosphatase PAP2 family protein [Rubellimicrobium mesophilum]EYD76294.1 putative integral membrane protein [Rubellimicrobium mesophilum DSM 19309]